MNPSQSQDLLTYTSNVPESSLTGYPPLLPSFVQQQNSRDDYPTYEFNSYGFAHVGSIRLPATGSYQSFVQTPTPFESLSPSPLLSDHISLTTPTSTDTNQDLLSPEDKDGDVVVSISTAFHPNNQPTPDTVISSSDGVLFYVHSKTIIDACPTAFQTFLSAPFSNIEFRNANIQLDAPSVELNVILHTLYGTSPAAHFPDFPTLVRAVDRMPAYSISPEALITPSSPLHELLLSHGPLHPLDTYALAAHHKLDSMAVSVSSHLLSFDLATITDEMAERIGAIYLKRLLLLHVGRFTSLKAILLHPPHPHPPTRECSFEDQKKLTRAWALVSAYLAWEARPDLSIHTMHTALNPLTEHLTCGMCHEALQERIKTVVVQWASVKSVLRPRSCVEAERFARVFYEWDVTPLSPKAKTYTTATDIHARFGYFDYFVVWIDMLPARV